MRVNNGRLDLKSLNVGQVCTITTGSSSIRMEHSPHTIEMGLYLKGVGMQPLRDDRLMSVQDEHGKGYSTYWLHLDRLAPRRLYEVLVTSPAGLHDEAMDPHFTGMPGWRISDNTPGEPPESEKESGGPPWGILGRLLGRRGE